MSGESVAPATRDSFLYEGCYRPRGGLSFAERAAWGLRTLNDPKSNAARAPRAPQASIRGVKHTSACGGLSPIAPLPRPRTPVRAGEAGRRRSRVLLITASVPYRELTAARQCITASARVTTRWRRFRIRWEGRSISCLSFGAHVFVTGGFVRAGERA